MNGASQFLVLGAHRCHVPDPRPLSSRRSAASNASRTWRQRSGVKPASVPFVSRAYSQARAPCHSRSIVGRRTRRALRSTPRSSSRRRTATRQYGFFRGSISRELQERIVEIENRDVQRGLGRRERHRRAANPMPIPPPRALTRRGPDRRGCGASSATPRRRIASDSSSPDASARQAEETLRERAPWAAACGLHVRGADRPPLSAATLGTPAE